jgi:hypothetical protein
MKIMTVVIGVAFLLASSIVSAVCLKGNPSIQEEYADSESVFIGRVLEKKDVSESGGYYEGDEYIVQVKEVFKGKPGKKIIIFSENSSGRFPMEIGKTYIIFLHQELGRYQIDNCGNSGLLSKKQDTVRSLRQLRETMIK